MMPEEEYTIGEFMTHDLVEVTSGTSVAKCAQIMAAENVSSAVVMNGTNISGIVTEKDLARKVVAKGLDSNQTIVQDIMTREVITATPDMTLYEAMLLLSGKKIKHLPVVKDNVALGIITAMDIMRVQPSLMEVMARPSESEPQEE